MTLVTPELRPQAYAFVQLSYNMLGYMPAPYLYGLIVQATQTPDKPSHWGMVFTFSMNIPAALLVTYSYYCKFMKGESHEKSLIE